MVKPVSKKMKKMLSDATIKQPVKKKKESSALITQKFYRKRQPDPRLFNPGYYKAGMFIANMRNDGLVMVGFSFCNHYAGDRYDYVEGKKIKDFGLGTAISRSYRWSKMSGYIIGPQKGDSTWKKMGFIFIPHFAAADFYKFLLRCDRYYKFLGEKLKYPEWIARFKEQNLYAKKEKKDDRHPHK